MKGQMGEKEGGEDNDDEEEEDGEDLDFGEKKKKKETFTPNRTAAATATTGKGGGGGGGKGRGKVRNFSTISSSKKAAAAAGTSVRFRSFGVEGGARIEGRLPVEIAAVLMPLLREHLIVVEATACHSIYSSEFFTPLALRVRVSVTGVEFFRLSHSPPLSAVAGRSRGGGGGGGEGGDNGGEGGVERGAVAIAASRLIHFLNSGKVDVVNQPAEEANESKKRRMMDSASSPAPSRQTQTAAAAAAVAGATEAAEAAEREDGDVFDETQLDRLYRLNEEHIRALPPFPSPLPLLRRGVELRRYQRQALAWMLKREGGKEGWKEGGMHLEMQGGKVGGKTEEEGEEKGGRAMLLETAAVAAKEAGKGGREGGKASVWLGEGLVKTSAEMVGEQALHHPLWDRYIMAEVEGGRKGGREGGVRLVNPVPFYSNPYSKVVQMERPVPPKECRGGILADDMVRGRREGGREGGQSEVKGPR